MTFHHSLRFRISLLFVLLMLAGNSLAIFVINRNVTARYASYVNQADKQRAIMTARILEDSWDEWSSEIHEGDHRVPQGTPLNDEYDEEEKRPRMGMMMGRMTSSEAVPMIIVDRAGKTLLSTIPVERSVKNLDFKKGIPIYRNSRVVAYVLAGTMIDQKMNPADKRMLSNINFILFISSLLSTLIILISGILLLGRILSPLKKIDRAASLLARGDMTARSGLNGYDEISKLGERFDSMAIKLEESDEWKRRIIADTAHELRTPAALMQSRLEMLRDGIYQADKKQLESLYHEAENFSRLIGDMQKLSSMEGNRVSLEKEQADLNQLCLSRIDSFQPAAVDKRITLTWNRNEMTGGVVGETKPLMALFDWNRVDQILKNLLSNALQHTPPEGMIDISTKLTDTQVLLCVADSGPGIPPAERERIFDRFYRLDKSRNRKEGGYGLGLAISQAIAQAHGGRITVMDSPLGGTHPGALFCLELPRE
jgi:signal transduction histidine kinase